MDSEERRNALIGHSALCLMSLLGFLLYTATYTVVYMVRAEGKPIAVLEMWMVLTHLLLSLLSCAIRAMGGNNTVSEVQSAIFLAVSLAHTGLGTACMQDSLYCSIYYPAAAFPPFGSLWEYSLGLGHVYSVFGVPNRFIRQFGIGKTRLYYCGWGYGPPSTASSLHAQYYMCYCEMEITVLSRGLV